METNSHKIITRFAPSPTGFLHIGGARTALFNWLFARHHGGEFLLRIEDTDRERSTDAAIEAIMDGMNWLGLHHDGEAISQFARADRHREVANQLLAEGHAYKCYATPQELATLREETRANGSPMRGDIWRDKHESDAPKDVAPAIRLRMPREGETIIHDLVQGDVTVKNSELDDMVLLRADGSPTYMLAVVVDDHDMEISHVIRGNDHLNNAFRQYQLYALMNWNIPKFAHIPLIHGADGKKLSKRHGALGVDAYRDMGYLPEALRNYLVRLGWSHGDDEYISTEKAIEWFNLESVVKSPARFDFDKLDNLNGEYIRQSDPQYLFDLIQSKVEEKIGHTIDDQEKAWLLAAIPSLKERAKRIPELVESAVIFTVSRPMTFTDKAAEMLNSNTIDILSAVVGVINTLDIWQEEEIKLCIKTFCDKEGLKMGKVMQPIRAALTGGHPSGDLIEIMLILGKAETIDRLTNITPKHS